MRPCRGPATERGAVLVVGLMLLMVLTILGVAAMQNALMEEKTAGNVQDSSVALQAAEAALREGELLLQEPVLPEFDGTSGLYPPPSPGDPPRWMTIDWVGIGDDEDDDDDDDDDDDASTVRTYRGFEDAPGSLSRVTARYIIEELPLVRSPGESLSTDTPLDNVRLYRITARGTGIRDGTVVILQSTYRR